MTPMSNSESRKREAELAPTPDRVRLTDEEREGLESAFESAFHDWWGDLEQVDFLTEKPVHAVEAILTAHKAALREQIAADIETEGREDVQWLASVASDSVDRARHIGAEDAYRAAARIARGDS